MCHKEYSGTGGAFDVLRNQAIMCVVIKMYLFLENLAKQERKTFMYNKDYTIIIITGVSSQRLDDMVESSANIVVCWK